mmetsp:Transcript_4196/g.4356  ORF Transcript_4196/g.4356 Transcript_4196/m.4356 type:complete len:386 (+) Transcript_4196:63-1220(+)
MLKTTVAGFDLDCCVYNASGPRTGTIEALEKIGSSKSGVILSKSATLNAQDGNALPRFINKIELGPGLCDGSMNSEGLPNGGIDYYISPEAVKSLTAFEKPYIVSLSGLSLKDNLEMLGRAMAIPEISAIELNLACPNIPGKPTIAYDFVQMEDVLKQVTSHPSFGKKPLGVKLAPYFDTPYFEQATTIISKYDIKFVVSINTIGNALFVDTDNECVSMMAKDGFGGLGGGYVKQCALANVRQLSLLFAKKGRSDIDIIGAGGVASGKDAFELILCGAKAVQVGTCHWTEGSGCFARIAGELSDIMQKKGYDSIENFRGKLKPYMKHPNNISRKNVKSDILDSKVSSSTSPAENLRFSQLVIALLTLVVAYLIADKNGILVPLVF